MQFGLWPAVLLSSIPMAGIYVLIGLSWTVIFRTTKVFNFATGEFAILGAYFFYELTARWHVNWWLSLVVVVILSFVLGGLAYLGLLRPLAGRPLWAPVTLTMGLALAIDAVMSIVWGDSNLQVKPPFGAHSYKLGPNAYLSNSDLLTFVLAAVVFGLVLAGFKWLEIGRKMRAAAESATLAGQSGISVHRMYALGWALATVVAAVAGVLYTMNTSLAPASISIGVLGLTPALIGGLDSIGGVFVGAVIASLITNFATLYVGGDALDAVSGILLLLIITLRPYGLFGTPEVVRV